MTALGATSNESRLFTIQPGSWGKGGGGERGWGGERWRRGAAVGGGGGVQPSPSGAGTSAGAPGGWLRVTAERRPEASVLCWEHRWQGECPLSSSSVVSCCRDPREKWSSRSPPRAGHGPHRRWAGSPRGSLCSLLLERNGLGRCPCPSHAQLQPSTRLSAIYCHSNSSTQSFHTWSWDLPARHCSRGRPPSCQPRLQLPRPRRPSAHPRLARPPREAADPEEAILQEAHKLA